MKEYNIEYWLNGGSLVVLYRYGKNLPYDIDDCDITLEVQHHDLIMSSKFTNTAWKKYGIIVRNRYLTKGDFEYYRIIRKWIMDGHEIDSDSKEKYGHTLGYGAVGNTKEKDAKLDIWYLFLIIIDDTTRYSIGTTLLYDRDDVFPLKPCWLNGQEHKCPKNI